MGIMNFVKNQNKRMRLDLGNNFDGNDDLWGQDDITAEEFDMLEVQATQGISTSSFIQPLPNTSASNILQIDSTKQNQYELEGKIKILTDTVTTLKKELTAEKLVKDKIVAERNHEFQEKEKLLQKEIKKLNSSLLFKDQEMITVYDKVKTLEIQLKESKTSAATSTSKSPNKYLKKFDFKTDVSPQSSNTKILPAKKVNRKYALCTDTLKGQTPSSDIISSIFCNRLILSTVPIHTPSNQLDAEKSTENIFMSPISITKLNLEKQTDDVFHYYYSVLENYVYCLQSFVSQTNFNLTISTKRKNLSHERSVVLSCLKDLNYLLSCPQFSDSIHSLYLESLSQEVKKTSQTRNSCDTPSTSSSSSLNCDKKNDKLRKKSLLDLLFTLSNPDFYPTGFACEEEVNWTLSSLVSWCAINSKSIVDSFNDKLIFNHISNSLSVTSTSIALRLLINICTATEYTSKLIHQSDTCHLCSFAILLSRTVSNSPLECINLMIMVEDFLTSVFTVHSSVLSVEDAPCSLKILQAFLSTLLKFYHSRNKGFDLTLLLKKGFALLHYLAKCIPNFKFRRIDCEDSYISTVCAMLSLSKEDILFKEFYEIARELWDFQEDTSEFDLEDLSDDSTPAMSVESENC